MNILTGLAAWSLRAALLAAAAGALLTLLRVRNVHTRSTVWTAVLACALLMPLAGPLLPPLPIPNPFSEPVAVAAVEVSDPPALPLSLPRPAARALRLDTADAVVLAWAAVALLLLARTGIGLLLARRLLLASAEVDGLVRESDRVAIPVTVGLLRPRILLPAVWRTWSADKLHAVLDHEHAHARRRDPLRQLLAALYWSLCWFHPLAWWLRAKLSDLAEAASDDAALTVRQDRAAYAGILVDFLAAAQTRPAWSAGAAMATRGMRRRRILRVLDAGRTLDRPLGPIATAAIVAAALALGGVALAARPVAAQSLVLPALQTPAAPPAQPGSADASPAQPTAAAAPTMCGGDTTYHKWLAEDVVYIITPQERADFQELRTAKACEEAVEQFWLRRDPTPESYVNEFKQEHYRRIGWANQRLAGGGLPGWRTDRGRTYIIYGPPDEIESHPGQWEQWRYRYLEPFGERVRFDFTDRDGRGDYRLKVQGPQGATPDDGLTVVVNPDRSAVVTIALTDRDPLHLYARIADESNHNVWVYEDEVRGQVVTTTRRLQPGRHRLFVVGKPAPRESLVLGRQLAFVVK